MAVLNQLIGGYNVTIPKNMQQKEDKMSRAFTEQKEIGFGNMLKGFMTKTFQTIQEQHYEAERLNNR